MHSERTQAPRRSPYLVGTRYDWALFLAPPLVAMALGLLVSGSELAQRELFVAGGETSYASFFLGALIHAHLVAVFVRSHGNTAIFRRHPVRFLVVPLLLWITIVLFERVAIAAMIVATFWDVWHSGAQTFGFARIYERNAGAPSPGRRLDFWLNQLLYAGPILAGATLMDHLIVLEELELFEDPVSTFLILVPADVSARSATLTWIVVGAGAAFLAYYVAAHVRMWRRGQRPSWLKVYLLVSTGICSIVTWGFNPWGEAFFIMNLFHAVQYLALVWAMEHGTLRRRLRLERARFGAPLTLALFLGAVGAYGVFVELLDPGLEILWAMTMVVSLMHFWYDAFIWSVRRRQV